MREESWQGLSCSEDDIEIKWYGSRSYIDQKYASIYQNMFRIVDDVCMDDNMKSWQNRWMWCSPPPLRDCAPPGWTRTYYLKRRLLI